MRAYRIGKFVRRRWPVVAAALIFFVLLATYAVTVTLQARQVAVERDRARESQRVAEEVTAYLVRMFKASDPSETRGDTITAKELLATGVAHADTLARIRDAGAAPRRHRPRLPEPRPLRRGGVAHSARARDAPPAARAG